MTPIRIDLLQRMPVFGAIGERTLAFLLQRAHAREVPAGQCFFHEGDEAQTMYVLERGRAEVVREAGGQAHRLRELQAGDCFGEMGLLDLHPRSATVRALQDCRAIAIGADDLLALYEHDLESFALIQMNLAREMSRRLRQTDDLLFRVWSGSLGGDQIDPSGTVA